MRNLLIPVAFLLFLGSCKKSDSGCSLSQSSILGTYKITAATYKENSSSAVENEYILWNACKKDDTITFTSDGVVTITDAGSVCSVPGNDTDGWVLISNTIVFTNIGSYTISNFSCSGMVLTYYDPADGETETITFAKQ